MSLEQWSERNELLNAFRESIQHSTRGLISDLSVDLTDDNCVVLSATSRNYHVAQLVIQATKSFADKHPLFPETRLLLGVDGSTLALVVPHTPSDDARNTVSTHDSDRHPQLTLPASV